ncbi:MAG: hypothetical protein WD851_04950 [Pirellulales bacterium]
MAKRRTLPAKWTIRQFHELGKRIKQECHGGRITRARRGAHLAYSRKHKISLTALNKAYTFAQQYPTQAKLNWICNLGQKHGTPLKLSHVFCLVTVKNPTQRDRLAKATAQQGWSGKQLTAEIHKIQPKRAYGGKRPMVASDPRVALHQLLHRTDQWLRLAEDWRCRESERKQPARAKRGLLAKLSAARAAMQQLDAALQQAFMKM